jgi:hypothetical protein
VLNLDVCNAHDGAFGNNWKGNGNLDEGVIFGCIKLSMCFTVSPTFSIGDSCKLQEVSYYKLCPIDLKKTSFGI